MLLGLNRCLLKPAATAGGGGFGAHKGWRIFVLSNQGGFRGLATARTSAGQIDFQDSVGASLSTSGGTIFEGGPGSVNQAATLAFDGSPTVGNPWSRAGTSGGNGVYIGCIFTTSVSCTQFKIWSAIIGWGNMDSETISEGRLQYSDDSTDGTNGTWTNAFYFWNPSWIGTAQDTRTFPQVQTGGRYTAYRLNVTASNDASFTLIQEMEVRATVGGADQCNGGAPYGSQANTNEEPFRAFDNTDGNNYDLHIPVTGWLMYVFPDTVVAGQYMIRCNSTNSRTPKTWDFQGTNDGVTFTTLNTQTNITAWVVPESKVFTV